MQELSFNPGCMNYIQVKYVHHIILISSVLKTMEELVDKCSLKIHCSLISMHTWLDGPWRWFYSLVYRIERVLDYGFVTLGNYLDIKICLITSRQLQSLVWMCVNVDPCHAYKLADYDGLNELHDESVDQGVCRVAFWWNLVDVGLLAWL
jgi:hypothetical protein